MQPLKYSSLEIEIQIIIIIKKTIQSNIFEKRNNKKVAHNNQYIYLTSDTVLKLFKIQVTAYSRNLCG